MTARTPPPGAPVVNFFDHNSSDYVTERFGWFTRIRDEAGPVAWSSLYGGHWIVVGARELDEALRDWETFSSKHIVAEDGTAPEPDGIRYQGMFMPPRAMAAPMIEHDPPEWTARRKALTPLFTPAAVERWRARIQMPVSTGRSKQAPCRSGNSRVAIGSEYLVT